MAGQGRMTPCPCARKWLAEMVEEGLRRKPESEGARWVLGWLLSESNLPMRRADGIMRELERQEVNTAFRALAIELKKEWGMWNKRATARGTPPQDREKYREKMAEVGARLKRVEAMIK